MRTTLHKKKLIGPVASICAILGSLAVQTACSKPEPIRIGFIGGLSSRTSDLGVSSLNGAILATEMRNASGGINGRPIELTIRDDGQKEAIFRPNFLLKFGREPGYAGVTTYDAVNVLFDALSR